MANRRRNRIADRGGFDDLGEEGKEVKREILKQFEELEELVDLEVKNISSRLLVEYPSYQEAIDALNDYYCSKFKLDDYVYSEIYKKMIARATK